MRESQAAPWGSTPTSGLLSHLLAAVVAARDSEKAALRQHGATADSLLHARWNTLTALEHYAAALAVLRWPLPRTIQLEIQLHKSLLRVTAGGERGESA